VAGSRVGFVSLAGTSDAGPSTSYTFQFGTSMQAVSLVAANIGSYSDRAIKENIEDLSLGVEFLQKLRPRAYDHRYPNRPSMRRKHLGFVVQEVRDTCLQEGLELSVYGDDEPEGNWTLNYAQLTAPLVKAVQELAAKVQDLQAQLDALKGGQ
jgi:hypothetical protein